MGRGSKRQKEGLELLEEINEEEIPTEYIELEQRTDPVRRIAHIFEEEKPAFNFAELTIGDIPSRALAYCFSKGLNPMEVNSIIAHYQSSAFLALISLRENYSEEASLISALNLKAPLVFLGCYLSQERSDAWKKDKPEDPILLQHTGPSLIPSIAAQALISAVPLLSSESYRINTFSDIRKIIFYSQLASNAEPDLKTRLNDLLCNKEKTASELANEGINLFSGGAYLAYNTLLEMAKGETIEKVAVAEMLNGIFGTPLKEYEQAICLAELSGNTVIIKKIFSKDKVYKEFKQHREELQKTRPDFAAAWQGIVSEYFKRVGFKRAVLEEEDNFSYSKLTYEGYRRVCTEFLLDKTEDKAGIFMEAKEEAESSLDLSRHYLNEHILALAEKRLPGVFETEAVAKKAAGAQQGKANYTKVGFFRRLFRKKPKD